MPRHPTPLAFLGPGWFAVVMGLAGLAAAWHRAVPLMGEMAGALALVVGAVAAAVLLLLLLASALRLQRHPKAWQEDLRHPMRHVLIAAIPIALLQVATVGVVLFGPHPLAEALWWIGSIGQFGVTLWVMARWWRGNQAGGLQWAVVTPALIIPIVGNVLVPLAGVPLGYPEWSAAQFDVGLLLWPVVHALILARIAVQGLWPARAQPGVFIFIAPPAVVGLAALQFGAPPLLAWMCWGIAILSFLWAAAQTRAILALPFGVPHWGMTFPLTALAALTLRLAGPTGPMTVLGPALLALASLVILMLSVATLRGLRDGSLLAPEPVAMIRACSHDGEGSR